MSRQVTMTLRHRWVLVVLAILVGACGESEPDMQVLFIGNSFTASNDLPGLVAEVASANGTTLRVEMVAPGGTRLSQHVVDVTVNDLVRSGDFDVVVIQEQSELPSIETLLLSETLPSARSLVRMAEVSGSQALFFQTWAHQDGSTDTPYRSYAPMQRALVAGYQILSDDTGADIAPVGATWAEVRRTFPNLQLYHADGYHPSPEGSYLAALVITSSLLTEPIETAPDVLIDQETADLLLSLVNS